MPRVAPTSLPGVLIVEPDVFRDDRGFFLETYHAAKYRDLGIVEPFVQDNHSLSLPRILRGLHLQTRRPQGKLVRVIRGAIFDVAVDVRRGSPHFGQWECYIPPGFAHGFCVLEGPAEVIYKCTTVYDPASEVGIAWNDPALAIAWPLPDPVLSPKDAALPPLSAVVDRLPALEECLAAAAVAAR
jgi:dTDP-4-dehydrorhamnose 3,5-epimerase